MTEVGAFDAAVDRAWDELRAGLADHLAGMGSGDALIVGAATADLDRLAVSVDFWVSGDDLVCFARCVGVDEDALLTVLARADGWVPADPHDPDTMVLELTQSDVARAAAATVTMLRDIAGLPHPCFAQARTATGPYVLTPVMAEPTIEQDRPSLHLIEYPANPAELHACVARALEWKFGTTPVTDGDHAFPVVICGHRSYVMPDPEAPQVRILVPLVADVCDRTRAAGVLTDLNSRLDFIRLTLVADQVDAIIDVPAQPFSTEHLGNHLDRMDEFLRRLDPLFAQRLGGRPHRDLPHDDALDDELPEGLQDLLRLNATGAARLDAHDVSAVCGHDLDTVTEFLRISEQQLVEWRERAALAYLSDELGDDHAPLGPEVSDWECLVELLRGALHVLSLGAPQRAERFEPPPEQPGPAD